jgi:gamma-glutamyltranspeptidase / glutathione hydrolase
LRERSPAGEPVLQQREALATAFDVRGRVGCEGLDAEPLLNDESVAGLLDPGDETELPPPDGDTTYMLAVDREGNAVSLIQSIFAPWGSRVFSAETGVLFNDRMLGFSLRPGHANELAPGKRPLHTLHCYLGTDVASGDLRIVGGTPGGHRQPQANLQVLDGLLRRGLDAQDALDEARWSLGARPRGRQVEVETRADDSLGPLFSNAGFEVERFRGWDGRMGRALLAISTGGGLSAAADLRGEGQALLGFG